MNEHEKKIKEERQVQAIREDLMGFDGKLGCIVRYMGQPILSQTSGGNMFSSTPGIDFWKIEDEQPWWDIDASNSDELLKKIPVIDIDGVQQPEGDIWIERPDTIHESINQIGWLFDGMNRGMHLEIKFLDENKELTVEYQGKLVYRELAGELECYVPMQQWESLVSQLYRVARKLQVADRKNDREQAKREMQRSKESWLDRMKSKWGFVINP